MRRDGLLAVADLAGEDRTERSDCRPISVEATRASPVVSLDEHAFGATPPELLFDLLPNISLDFFGREGSIARPRVCLAIDSEKPFVIALRDWHLQVGSNLRDGLGKAFEVSVGRKRKRTVPTYRLLKPRGQVSTLRVIEYLARHCHVEEHFLPERVL